MIVDRLLGDYFIKPESHCGPISASENIFAIECNEAFAAIIQMPHQTLVHFPSEASTEWTNEWMCIVVTLYVWIQPILLAILCCRPIERVADKNALDYSEPTKSTNGRQIANRKQTAR